MSGRRSSSVAGSICGTTGTGGSLPLRAIANDDGGHAEQNGDRMLRAGRAASPTRSPAPARAGQLSLREQHVGSRGDAAFEANLRQVVRALVTLRGALEQRLLNLRRAHQEVGLRQRGLGGQLRRGKVVRRSPDTTACASLLAWDSCPHRSTSQLATTPAESAVRRVLRVLRACEALIASFRCA